MWGGKKASWEQIRPRYLKHEWISKIKQPRGKESTKKKREDKQKSEEGGQETGRGQIKCEITPA